MQLRTKSTKAVLAVLAVFGMVTAAACGGSSLGGGSSDDAIEGEVKIGLLVPQSGVYKPLGDDMKNAFELYLDQNDGKLGGHDVDLRIADEGETPETGRSAATKLLEQDDVLAVSGVVNSAVMNSVKDMFESNEVPLVGSNASPTTLTDVDYIWRTSYVNDEPGKALGEWVANNIDGPVYLIAADYQAGEDEIEGFKETFEPAGGEIAGEIYTPFPDTTNFQPYLSKIRKADAAAAFTFYAGGAAVDFVKQYDKFGLADDVPLYGAGFLTEGGVLDAQAQAAEGVFTSMNYSASLENELNTEFVEAYEKAHGNPPTTYAVASYDAAHVLDKAIEDAGDGLTSQTLKEAIDSIGDIESPRGTWKFNGNGTPIQTWYLREVQDGENVAIDELGTVGDK